MVIEVHDNGVLCCPLCGGESLHHGEVITYARREDAKETTVTWTSLQGIAVETVKSTNADNPSPRRHGLSIMFMCETCERPSWLRLGQHKGSTLVEWGKK
jgi:hypothetical protein